MHPEDAFIVVALPASTHAASSHGPHGESLWEALGELLRANQLGQVAGYAAGDDHREIRVLVDRVSWEAAWEVIRTALARHGLLGAATVRLEVPDDQPTRILWPPQ